MPKKASNKDQEPQKPAITRRNIIILAALGIVFIALLFSVSFRQISEASFSDGTFGKAAYQALSGLPFFNIKKDLTASTATIFIEGDTLKASFNFTPNDSNRVIKMSESLGVEQGWSNGVAVTLDEDTILKLKQSLPGLRNGEKLVLDVVLSDKSIEFTNQKFWKTPDVLVNSQNMTASGSGQVIVQNLENGGIGVEINNPADVLRQQEGKGNLNLSSKIQDSLWQLAPKFTRIELQVTENNFQGKIFLR